MHDDQYAPPPRLPESRGDLHHRHLEAHYHAAPTNAFMPATMTVGHGAAQLTMPMRDEYGQAVGMVHGMVACKVLDEVAFYAANSLVDDVWLTTAALNVQLVGPISTAEELHAAAQVVHAGRSSFTVDAQAWTAGGVAARATATIVRTRQPLTAAQSS